MIRKAPVIKPSLAHFVINRYSLNNAILQYHDTVVSEETFNWIVKTIHTNSTTVDKDEIRKRYEMHEEESIMAAEPDVEKK